MAKPSTSATASGALSTGLTHSWLLNEGSGNPKDYITGATTATLQLGATWTTVAGEPAVQSTSTAHYVNLLGDPGPTTAATIVFGYQKADGTARASGAVGVSAPSGTNAMGVHLPYSDGTIYFDYAGNSVGTTRLTYAGATFGNDIWIFTTGARGMEIWQNGTKLASNAATPTRATNAAQTSLGSANGATSDLANYIFLHIYNIQLSTTDIATLSSTPYAMFSAPAGRTTKNTRGWGLGMELGMGIWMPNQL